MLTVHMLGINTRNVHVIPPL